MTTIKPPDGLSKRATAVWKAVIVHDDGFELSVAEQELFVEALRSLDRADQCRAVVDSDGVVVTDRFGGVKSHPALDLETRCRAQYASFVKQLGVKLADDEPTDGFGRRRPGPKPPAALPRSS